MKPALSHCHTGQNHLLSKTRLDYARNLKICNDSRDTNVFLENIHISTMTTLVLLTSALFARKSAVVTPF